MILVTGAAGFVGRNLVGKLAGSAKLRCLVRNPEKAAFLKEAGCELVRGDITDPPSIKSALTAEVSTVIHLVGILVEPKGATFSEIHTEGTRSVVDACVNAGVKRYLHISALGTRPDARSKYHRTKWQAEEIIRASGLDYTIFRPSVLFGRGDKFTNVFAGVMRLSPVVMVPGGGRNRMQPVSVVDLTTAMAASLGMDETKGKVYEIAGPRVYSFDEVLDEIARVLGKRIFKIHVPMPLMRIGAALAEALLAKPPVSRDALIMLEEDNVTDENALADVFGIVPTGFAEGMSAYLH